MSPKLPPEEFKYIYSKVPCLCVEAIVETDDGIVLTKRAVEPDIGTWHLTGGTVMWGEKLEDVARRVVREELGVEAEVVEMLGVIEYSFPGYFRHPVSVAYRMKPLSTDFRVDHQAEEWRVFKTLPANMMTGQEEFVARTMGYESSGRVIE